MRTEHDVVFVDGEFRQAGSHAHFGVYEAATGDLLGTVPNAGDAEIDAAISSARAAAAPWRDASASERTEILTRFAGELLNRGPSAARLVTRENGMPISLSRRVSGQMPALTIRHFAGKASVAESVDIRTTIGGRAHVRRDPVGVVGAITPWNYPLTLAAMKIAPALAVGCTTVLKPAPETSLDVFVLAEAAVAAGLPPGVLNIVTGDNQTGAALVNHPGLDKITFTGSTRAGRTIGEASGRLLRPTTLELGGKSAAVVLDDVDADLLVRGLYDTAFANNGQTCYSSSRILLPRNRYKELSDAICGTVEAFRVGDPLDDSTQIGPVVSVRQQRRIIDIVTVAVSHGARVRIGGAAPFRLGAGSYVEPTVLEGVASNNIAFREEIFGPVVTLTPYDTVDNAIALANDSEFGLAGTVWSRDLARAMDVARRIETGSVGINGFALDPAAPFGGRKSSGLGYELGVEGIAEYQHLQAIHTFDAPTRPRAGSENEVKE